jgi:hypothetical protein
MCKKLKILLNLLAEIKVPQNPEIPLFSRSASGRQSVRKPVRNMNIVFQATKVSLNFN